MKVGYWVLFIVFLILWGLFASVVWAWPWHDFDSSYDTTALGCLFLAAWLTVALGAVGEKIFGKEGGAAVFCILFMIGFFGLLISAIVKGIKRRGQ